MIKEDYVSWETGKLMGENGFDQDYPSAYYDYRIIDGVYIAPVPRPTLQTAMKWLREVHHIFIRVIQSHIEYCTCEIYYNKGSYYQFRESFNSYEQACEAAIKYCLENLI